MDTLTARVVGFSSSSPVTYTTEVVARDAVRYSLALRYSTFLAAYTKLVEADASFEFKFPEKGGFFWSPPPAERQPQLDAFLVAALAHLAKREYAAELRVVLEELLAVAANTPAVDEKAGSETSESSVDEPVKAPIAKLVAAKVVEEQKQEQAAVEPEQEAVVEEEEEADVEETKPLAEEEVTIDAKTAVKEPKKEESSVVEPADEEVSAAEDAKTEEAPVVVAEPVVAVEESKERVVATPVVEEPIPAVVEEPLVAASEPAPATSTTTATSPSSSPKKKKKKSKAQTAASTADPLAVASTVTTTTAAGGEVQHITFANGMSLKKKTLSEDQKRLRNMRRKEKRKKASLKVRGGKASHKGESTSSTEDDD